MAAPLKDDSVLIICPLCGESLHLELKVNTVDVSRVEDTEHSRIVVSFYNSSTNHQCERVKKRARKR